MGRAITLLMVVGLAACGSGRGDTTEPIPVGLDRPNSPLPGFVGRRCELVSRDAAVPAFADLARLGTRGNIALWGQGQAPTDTVEVSVRYGEDGRLAWARAIRSTVPAERIAPLETLVLGAVREQGQPDWGFRMAVVGGDLVATAPSVICPADLRRSIRRAVPMPRTRAALITLDRIQGQRFQVLISLDEQGRILHVRLPRSTGESSVDQYLINWVMEAEFHPKLHDGIPVATTIQETLTIPRRR
jgi:hypothetical protein